MAIPERFLYLGQQSGDLSRFGEGVRKERFLLRRLGVFGQPWELRRLPPAVSDCL